MKNITKEDQLREFMGAMGQKTDLPQPSGDLLLFRYELITEEVAELGEELAICIAESNFKSGIPDKVKARVLKELADCIYVLYGLAVTMGLPIDIAFNRVHKSNMSKLGYDGKPIYREDGKVMKGPNYSPPNLEDLVDTNNDYLTSEGVV